MKTVVTMLFYYDFVLVTTHCTVALAAIAEAAVHMNDRIKDLVRYVCGLCQQPHALILLRGDGLYGYYTLCSEDYFYYYPLYLHARMLHACVMHTLNVWVLFVWLHRRIKLRLLRCRSHSLGRRQL